MNNYLNLMAATIFGTIILIGNTSAQEINNDSPGRELLEIDGKSFESIDDMIIEVKGTGLLSTQYKNVKKWANGEIPVSFSDDYTEDEKDTFFQACDWWEQIAKVSCKERTSQADYVFVQADEKVNNSFIGRVGGKQVMKIASRSNMGVIAHELAHALGFAHQQNSPERDKFVEINWQNIKKGKGHNFKKLSKAILFGDYDYCSIMHYSRLAFSKNGDETINVLRRNVGCTVGQRGELSGEDKLGMIAAYGQDDSDERIVKVPNLVGKVVGRDGSRKWILRKYGVQTVVIEKTSNGKRVDKLPRAAPPNGCAATYCGIKVTSQFPLADKVVDFGTAVSIKINQICEPINRC